MTARVQAVVMLLLAVALGRLATTDELLRLVPERSRIWVLIASVIIGLLALWSLLASFRRPNGHENGHDDGHDDGLDDGHGHGHAGSQFAWLVALPVVVLLVIGPPSLGAFTANRQQGNERLAADASGGGYAELPADRTSSLRMIDFHIRANSDKGQTLRNRRVQLTGFVARPRPDGFVLSRLIIVCCAADGLPVDVRIITDESIPSTNHWVRVTGTYAGQDGPKSDVPVLKATRVRPVGAPSNPYE